MSKTDEVLTQDSASNKHQVSTDFGIDRPLTHSNVENSLHGVTAVYDKNNETILGYWSSKDETETNKANRQNKLEDLSRVMNGLINYLEKNSGFITVKQAGEQVSITVKQAGEQVSINAPQMGEKVWLDFWSDGKAYFLIMPATKLVQIIKAAKEGNLTKTKKIPLQINSNKENVVTSADAQSKFETPQNIVVFPDTECIQLNCMATSPLSSSPSSDPPRVISVTDNALKEKVTSSKSQNVHSEIAENNRLIFINTENVLTPSIGDRPHETAASYVSQDKSEQPVGKVSQSLEVGVLASNVPPVDSKTDSVVSDKYKHKNLPTAEKLPISSEQDGSAAFAIVSPAEVQTVSQAVEVSEAHAPSKSSVVEPDVNTTIKTGNALQNPQSPNDSQIKSSGGNGAPSTDASPISTDQLIPDSKAIRKLMTDSRLDEHAPLSASAIFENPATNFVTQYRPGSNSDVVNKPPQTQQHLAAISSNHEGKGSGSKPVALVPPQPRAEKIVTNSRTGAVQSDPNDNDRVLPEKQRIQQQDQPGSFHQSRLRTALRTPTGSRARNAPILLEQKVHKRINNLPIRQQLRGTPPQPVEGRSNAQRDIFSKKADDSYLLPFAAICGGIVGTSFAFGCVGAHWGNPKKPKKRLADAKKKPVLPSKAGSLKKSFATDNFRRTRV
eukprot:GHVT01029086.1.p1 GENE.GHVT01029086.1~~GHVT01029086.1.p1  ORF type:complete len:669 (+),score=47.09 GHVT01029086.1:660-2666(+)